MEFARHAHVLLISLDYHNTPGTPEVWADCLLDFHECYQQGTLTKTTQGTLGIDAHLQNKLIAL
ncbi:hypothetical protein C0989_007278, partial [Termitomyces sp. Mn162]